MHQIKIRKHSKKKDGRMRTYLKFATTLLLLSSATAQAQLPDLGMEFVAGSTELVVTDPQNDFLSPDGVAWGVVENSVTENNTVENLGSLLKAAKAGDMPIFISPHYYYPTDHGWKFAGALEKLMHLIGIFDRKGALDTTGLDGSGADWLEQYKPYINDGETIITNPHKVFGPESDDLVLQLRKRGIEKAILAGMSATLCTESHMRELIKQGFEVVVISDATAAAQVAEGDGYQSALVNFRFIANSVWSTSQAVENIKSNY
jgi:nicotinamidase-related amidase